MAEKGYGKVAIQIVVAEGILSDEGARAVGDEAARAGQGLLERHVDRRAVVVTAALRAARIRLARAGTRGRFGRRTRAGERPLSLAQVATAPG